MRSITLTPYVCPGCHAWYESQFSALTCCVFDDVDAWECPECGAAYETMEAAAVCCETGEPTGPAVAELKAVGKQRLPDF